MSSQSKQGKLGSTYFEMHRVSWTTRDGDDMTLFLAGTDAHTVRITAARLSRTIASESLVQVNDDVIMSTEVDLDELPF